jgi:hypothetical protein
MVSQSDQRRSHTLFCTTGNERSIIAVRLTPTMIDRVSPDAPLDLES